MTPDLVLYIRYKAQKERWRGEPEFRLLPFLVDRRYPGAALRKGRPLRVATRRQRAGAVLGVAGRLAGDRPPRPRRISYGWLGG